MNYHENLLTVSDVAKVLSDRGISLTPASIRWHSDQGNLPPQRTHGGTRLFRFQDVEKFAAERLRNTKRAGTVKQSDEEAAKMMIKASHLVPCRPGDLGRSEEDLVRALLAQVRGEMRILKAEIARLEKARA